MPMLVLNRNFILRSVRGHTVRFEKGVPVFVPPMIVSEALAVGAMMEDGSAPAVEEPADALPKEPQDVGNRIDLIKGVIGKLLERNQRSDFTAAGLPTAGVVESLLGFKVSNKEISQAWQQYHAEKVDE